MNEWLDLKGDFSYLAEHRSYILYPLVVVLRYDVIGIPLYELTD